MRRTLTWLVTLPFAAASVLVGHAIAYRLVGVPNDNLHGYLAHVPQIVFILATVAVVGLAADTRARRQSPVPLASLGIVAFVAQEHLERLVHTGHLPFLLTSPVLWLGIALQIPLAAVIWVVVRRLADDLAAPTRRSRPRIGRLLLALAVTPEEPVFSASRTAQPARGPPVPS